MHFGPLDAIYMRRLSCGRMMSSRRDPDPIPRSESVGENQARASLHSPFQGFLDQGFALAIETAGDLIQQTNFSTGWIIESRQQIGDGRFPGTTGPDQGRQPSGFDLKFSRRQSFGTARFPTGVNMPNKENTS